ncbi:MAG: 1-acyl-sn-glycerol-3-phosphate acyltransferase [Chitinophagaceae bacterium]|nr:1-acyl-sn-glycerol-3-phosphate acyltransferase [Chitinophagaceae bacterium]
MFLSLPFILIAALFGVKGGNFIYKVCRVWSAIWYTSVGISHQEIYEVSHDKDKQYIFVANHLSYMDIPPIVLAVKQPVRALGKAEMVKMPVFGWVYKAAVIQVNRDNSAHRAKSVRALKAAIKHGISIFIFPEGYLNYLKQPLKSFYDGAFRIAIETQTNIKPVLMIDSLDRMHYGEVFTLTPGKNRVVFLDEISVQGLTMKDLEQLKNNVYAIMEEKLKQYINYNELFKRINA